MRYDLLALFFLLLSLVFGVLSLVTENEQIRADLARSQQQTIEARIRLGQCVAHVMAEAEKGL